MRSAAEIAALLVKRQREFGPHLRADFRRYLAPTDCAAVASFGTVSWCGCRKSGAGRWLWRRQCVQIHVPTVT